MSTLVVDQPAEGVTRITLERPERLNAMNATLIAELHEALGGDRHRPCVPGRRPDGCRSRILRRDRPLPATGAAPGADGPGPSRGHVRHPDRTSPRSCPDCARCRSR